MYLEEWGRGAITLLGILLGNWLPRHCSRVYKKLKVMLKDDTELILTYLAIHCNMYIDNVFTTFLLSSINTGRY